MTLSLTPNFGPRPGGECPTVAPQMGKHSVFCLSFSAPSLKASSAASETLSSVSQTLSTEAISAAAENLSDVSEAIPLSSRPKEDDVL